MISEAFKLILELTPESCKYHPDCIAGGHHFIIFIIRNFENIRRINLQNLVVHMQHSKVSGRVMIAFIAFLCNLPRFPGRLKRQGTIAPLHYRQVLYLRFTDSPLPILQPLSLCLLWLTISVYLWIQYINRKLIKALSSLFPVSTSCFLMAFANRSETARYRK